MFSKNRIAIWSLTINSSTNDEYSKDNLLPLSEVEGYLKQYSKEYVIGREIAPTTGRYHYQIYIHLTSQVRNPFQLIKLDEEKKKHWTWSPARDRYALKEYAKKENICANFLRSYTPVKVFDYLELTPLQSQMHEIIQTRKNDRRIFVFSDYKGNSGKSYLVKYFLNNYCTILIPQLGTIDSMAHTTTRMLAKIGHDPGVQNVYVFFDITRTSPFLSDKNRKSSMTSLLESIVTGLLTTSFNGVVSSYYAKAGFAIPIILTNENVETFDSMFSEDRRENYWLYNKRYIKFNKNYGSQNGIENSI